MKSKINNAYLIDVRSEAEFASGSAKDAVNIPLQNLSKHNFTQKKDQSIVVFCKSGMRSSQAQKILHNKGFTDVHNGGSLSNIKKLLTEKSI